MVNPHRILIRTSLHQLAIGTFALTLESMGPAFRMARKISSGTPADPFQVDAIPRVPVVSSEGLWDTSVSITGQTSRSEPRMSSSGVPHGDARKARKSNASAWTKAWKSNAPCGGTPPRFPWSRSFQAAPKRNDASCRVRHGHPRSTPSTCDPSDDYSSLCPDGPGRACTYLNSLENRSKALAGLLEGLIQCHQIEAGRLPPDTPAGPGPPSPGSVATTSLRTRVSARSPKLRFPAPDLEWC